MQKRMHTHSKYKNRCVYIYMHIHTHTNMHTHICSDVQPCIHIETLRDFLNNRVPVHVGPCCKNCLMSGIQRGTLSFGTFRRFTVAKEVAANFRTCFLVGFL